MTDADLATYYARRAAEYDRVFAKPERQDDLRRLRARLGVLFEGRHLLEIACGTGWWTEAIAPHAAGITALDVNEEVLAIARARHYPPGRVRFALGDAYALPDCGRVHDALFGGFWWSHVPRERLEAFLGGAVRAVAPGATLVFLDNRLVAGSSTPVTRTDAVGNTYQMRRLEDGSAHEVLKNFPQPGELSALADACGLDAQVELLPYYWLLCLKRRG